MSKRFSDRIVDFLRQPGYEPLRTHKLARAMGVAEAEMGGFREAMDALRGFVLADFIEPPPTPLLAPTAPLGAVMQVFAENPSDFFYVSCDGVKLAGVVTLADIMRAQAANAPLESPVASIMTKDPVAITQADTCVVAAAAFRESSANFLPVVADQSSGRIVGFIRARKLLAAALPRMAKASVPPR